MTAPRPASVPTEPNPEALQAACDIIQEIGRIQHRYSQLSQYDRLRIDAARIECLPGFMDEEL